MHPAIRAGSALLFFCALPSEARAEPTLEMLAPTKSETPSEVCHLLCRTDPDATVTVAGKPAEVYRNGAFAADNLPLELGANAIEIVATAPDGVTTTQTLQITRVEPAPPKPVTTLTVSEPARDAVLPPGEQVVVRAVGPPGLSGTASIVGQPLTTPLAEELAEGEPTGRYTAVLRVPDELSSPAEITVRLEGESPLESAAPGKLAAWPAGLPRVVEVTADRLGVVHGLHYIRLGGPYLAELPRGTRLEAVGSVGNMLQVRLCEGLTGWVRAEGRDGQPTVDDLPPGTPVPANHFTYFLITGGPLPSNPPDGEPVDTVTIGLSAPVAHAVRSRVTPTADGDRNELLLDLFNTHHATTWISRKETAALLGDPTVEQVTDGRLRITVPVAGRQLWGYWTELTGNTLRLHVRRGPGPGQPDAPLAGKVIALEAGHGGSDSGAVGRLGLREKDANLMAVTALDEELRRRGAETVLLRPDDTSPSLWQRAEQANASGAHLLVSIHANAAGTARGFLRVSGTSVYFLGEHNRRPAEILWRQMLSLDWNDFGLVGNFHYTPLRNTRTPAVLIEQAFLSHPGDEARLGDPEYHRQQAVVIADGLESFFRESSD
ncbi:MAG: N-acetylmuramoyl-L-alanine amidase [Planctomycetota bacterium]